MRIRNISKGNRVSSASLPPSLPPSHPSFLTLGIVDTKLLEAVVREAFKPKNVQDRDRAPRGLGGGKEGGREEGKEEKM